jgi:protein TonB
MAVYLAVPSMEVQQSSNLDASLAKNAVAKPVVIFRPVKKVRPEPVKADPEPVVETSINDKLMKEQINPLQEQLVQIAEQPAVEISKTNTVTSEPRPSTSALGPEFQPDTRHQTPDTALLAYAGDPAALGMLARDALGPNLVQAQILSLPEPLYPVLCRKRGEEGRVVLEVKISAEGGVRSAEISESSSYARLDREALKAVKMATFRPATESGVPVQSERTIAYRFRLENK